MKDEIKKNLFIKKESLSNSTKQSKQKAIEVKQLVGKTRNYDCLKKSQVFVAKFHLAKNFAHFTVAK